MTKMENVNEIKREIHRLQKILDDVGKFPRTTTLNFVPTETKRKVQYYVTLKHEDETKLINMEVSLKDSIRYELSIHERLS